ncbi:uncharacterized protein KY384_004066 [Bacidia gigantensis]|uniref:uncharacterized protein n=1 Tax=Bacidia gigantensis TaxID=2732470 RepID=UPI001D038DB9|nr:uncharacterized protein KY384_004066 [Bacidia gigantensis]KAG8530710.1 hypothetical protein KY384_004066 [Bacidia gigantensis]
MAELNPTGPSQPSLNEAYKHPDNPAQGSNEHAASESAGASTQRSAPTYTTREAGDVPDPQQEDATPSSLGYGVQDASQDKGDSIPAGISSLDAEQMRAPGEGDIASAQDKKHGFGEQTSLTSGLDRKKAEQEDIKSRRGGDEGGGPGGGQGGGDGVDIAGALGEDRVVGAESNGGAGIGGGGQGDHTHV